MLAGIPQDHRPRGRRLLRAGAVAAVVLGLLVWWLLPQSPGPTPHGSIAIATGMPTGVYAQYGKLLKRDLAADLPALEVRLLRSEGSMDNLQQLSTGRADFALATADAAATYGYRGEPGAEHLRACARLYDDYMQLIVPRNSPVHATRDLKGLRVAVGADGSGVQLITRRLLQAARIGFDHDIVPVRVGIDRAPAMLQRHEIDAFFWSGGLPTGAVQTLSEQLQVRLVPLGDLLEPLHAMGWQTYYYRAAVIPTDAYPDMHAAEAVKTIAVANLLVTRDDIDSDLTESITRTVIRNRDSIGTKVHAAQKVDFRTAIYTNPLQLHAGARRYYVSAKP
ncbi:MULTISPECIES: TAXI family TRAP transporter solute-binding subunit [Streptomyces]|uniref:TAXI family TRAP transporter solute-binding subunit n=1 Tax=Streptomyces luteosporeus TaxID=173856 RepID=A0ABN3TMA8_9ACTN